MNARQRCLNMAEAAEARWDGLTSIMSTIGISLITAVGAYSGVIGQSELLLAIVSLSGIGGYSLHNVVRGGNKQ